MSTNAQKIQEWRDSHPVARLKAHDLLGILGGADPRFADLSGADLSGADLSGADLRGANFYGANFYGADLSDANFYGADLRGANLYGANFYGADLSGANFYGANFRGADLSGADLSDANLSGAELSGANLYGANFYGADLSGANFYGANFYGARGVLGIPVGLPSGSLILWRGPNGWRLKVGCWEGTPELLRSLIAQDEGWPEARGAEVVRRRPFLEAALALCDAYISDTEKKDSE